MSNVREILDLTKGLNEVDEALIKKAYDFSERVHQGQKRASGDPYFTHLVETAKILGSLEMDAQTIAGGLLHDVLENTEVTEKELEEKFGSEVLFLVNGVTNLGTLKYRGRERHVESLRKFFVAMASDLRVVIIKFSDRLHNLRTLQYLREDKRKRIAMESLEVYAQLANRLGMGRMRGELEDAAFPFAFPKENAQIEEIIKEKKDLYQKNLSEVKKELEKELGKGKHEVLEMNYRIKHKYSLWKKLIKREMNIEKVYDIVALRVVVTSIEECYRVLGLIHSIWKPLPGRIKDYVATPKPNGYRSIHTTIFTGDGGIAEIQIRTKEMQQEAAFGVAAYFAYKEQSGRAKRDDKFKFQWLEELKGLNYTPRESNKFMENLKTDFFSDRIFIFTPEGDIVDLPEDSSPIDFAYAIHSDIGHHLAGVKINGKMSSIFSKLKNKDIVEILKKDTARPSGKWLANAKTTLAKRHIRSYLEKHSLLSRLKSFRKSR